jgi:mRNA interferase MazF
MQRGDIWWASLPIPQGSEPGYRRPVLVVQADVFNRSRIETVLVAAITSNVRLAEAPGNVRLTRRQSGLPRESVVNISRLWTLDKTRLTDHVGRLPAEVMKDVDEGLKRVLSL